MEKTAVKIILILSISFGASAGKIIKLLKGKQSFQNFIPARTGFGAGLQDWGYVGEFMCKNLHSILLYFLSFCVKMFVKARICSGGCITQLRSQAK